MSQDLSKAKTQQSVAVKVNFKVLYFSFAKTFVFFELEDADKETRCIISPIFYLFIYNAFPAASMHKKQNI